MIAGLVLGRFSGYRRQIDLAMLRGWIAGLEGWKEIDYTCQSVFTAEDLLARWGEWYDFLCDAAVAVDPSLRRASVVLLVLPVRKSSDERIVSLVEANVLSLSHEADKLITKAISWVLREATKCNAPRVEAFLNRHASRLPAVALREARRKLETGRK